MFRTTTARPLITGAMLLTVPLLLTGCGGDGDKKADDAQPAATSTPAPESSTSAPATSDTAAPPATDGGRPTREAVVAGVKSAYGTGPAQAVLDTDKLAGCITDGIYDQVSPETLQALADGKPADIRNADDARSVTKAVGTCTPQAKRKGLPSLPSDIPTSLPSLPTDIPGL